MGSYVGADGAGCFPRSHTFTQEVSRLLCLSNVYYCWKLDQYMLTKYAHVLTAAYYVPHFCDMFLLTSRAQGDLYTHNYTWYTRFTFC